VIRGEDSVSWGAFAARVRAAAGALGARGIGAGDRILLHSRNSAAMLETMWASWMLGAVWVPTNFRLTPAEVAALLRRIASLRDRGVTLLLVEHNMDLVMNVADRILVMDYGQQLFAGAPADVQAHPDVIAAYLGANVL